jgi:hypothetical protein
MTSHDENHVLAVRDQHEAWLDQQPGVTGTGVGIDAGGAWCIKVYTNHMPAATREAIRQRLQDVPVEFEETGEIRAW